MQEEFIDRSLKREEKKIGRKEEKYKEGRKENKKDMRKEEKKRPNCFSVFAITAFSSNT